MSSLDQRRIFDLQQANRTLPLVSRIVDDIVRSHRQLATLHDRARQLVKGGNREEAEKLQEEMQALAYDIDGFIDELADVGCELKDPRMGLVDFPARLDDRIVLLCWKRGEPEISHWHEISAGFRGRRPVEGLRFQPPEG